MEVEFNWEILERSGIAGVVIVLVYFGFQAFKIIIGQWGNSTDAVNKNTEAFRELSRVFERSHERELEFQEDVKAQLTLSAEREKETLRKVNSIHAKLLVKEETAEGGNQHAN